MDRESKFEVFDQHQEISLEKIGKNGLTTLFGGGIVNPFGPTLTVIATDGRLVGGANFPILYIMLNPFRVEVKIVGQAVIGDVFCIGDLHDLLNLPLGSCPTLLLPSALWDMDYNRFLYMLLFVRFKDASKTFDSVEKYVGDPWNRVSNAMAEMVEDEDKPDSSDMDGKSSGFSVEKCQGLAEILLDPTNLNAELQAFLYAWQGSIRLQENNAAVEVVLSYQAFNKLFSKIVESCHYIQMYPDLG